MHCMRIHVVLELGEAKIHQAHLLAFTAGFECPHKSIAPFIELFSLAIAFELLLLRHSSGNGASFHILIFHFLHW